MNLKEQAASWPRLGHDEGTQRRGLRLRLVYEGRLQRLMALKSVPSRQWHWEVALKISHAQIKFNRARSAWRAFLDATRATG